MAYEPTLDADLTVAQGGARSQLPSTFVHGGARSRFPSTLILAGILLRQHQILDDFRNSLQASTDIYQLTPHTDGTADSATAPPSPDNRDRDDDDSDDDDSSDDDHDDGVSEEVVARFLETVASEGGEHGPCAVCLDDLHGQDRKVGVLRCRHGFHGECIGKWLLKKNVCPLCRGIVVID